MKNKDFFYLQYDKIDWQNQEKTRINSFVNNFIIKNVLPRNKKDKVKLFDIGFGIGFFFNMLKKSFDNIVLEGCEPSRKNYDNSKLSKDIKAFNKKFLDVKTGTKFDFITSIYVFPHFDSSEMVDTVKKIHSMLEEEGKFILVVANDEYLQDKLTSKKDLFIEKNIVKINNNKYNEVLHYSEIPEIGTIVDYNREEKFYIDLFEKNGFDLTKKENLDDNGFICTIFVFSKI